MRAYLLQLIKSHPFVTATIFVCLAYFGYIKWTQRQEVISQDRYEKQNQELIKKVQTLESTAAGERAKAEALQVELTQLAASLAQLRQTLAQSNKLYAESKKKSTEVLAQPAIILDSTVPSFDDLCKRAGLLHIECKDPRTSQPVSRQD